MLKKTLQVTVALFFIGSGSFAQWGGSTTTSGDTYRDGNVGIGTFTPGYKLQVNGFSEIGDQGMHDPSGYGALQLIRPANQGDDKFHLAFIRAGNMVTGMGYAPNTNTFGIWAAPPSGVNSTPTMSFHPSGNVGIGTLTPSALFHVYNGNVPVNTVGSEAEFARFSGSTSTNASQFRFLLKRHTQSSGGWQNMSGRLQFTTDVTDQGYIEFNPKDGFSGIAFGSELGEIMRLHTSGNVGIGTTNPGSFKLAVEGKIAARGVKVTTYAFADYVFDSTYLLRPLSNLEKYINENKHLPGIQSAKEVEKEGGFELGEMNVKLLEKVEELTLYILELNKKLEQQQKEIDQLKRTTANN